MGRRVVLSAALFLLASALLVAAPLLIAATGDDVTFAETVLAGDRGAAEGLVAEVDAYASGSGGVPVLWESFYAFGADAPETTYSFGARAPESLIYPDYYADWPGPLALNAGVSAGSIRKAIVIAGGEPTGLTQVARRLQQQAANHGTSRPSETIRLADYYDYYPIDGSLMVDGRSTPWVGDPVFADQWPAIARAISGHIRIPVGEEDRLTLTLTAYSSNTFRLDWVEGGPGYDLAPRSVWAEDAVYFTIRNRTDEGDPIDTGHIPGGYGVYRLPYAVGGEGELQWGAVSTVCPLDPSAEVLALHLAEGGSRLLVTAREGEEVTVTFWDTAAWRQAQKLTLPHIRQTHSETCRDVLFFGDDHLAVALTPTELALYAPGTDGLWELKFTTPALADAAPEAPLPAFLAYRPWETATAWDGERLAVAAPGYTFLDEERIHTERDCGFLLAVYHRGGLGYLGRYDSSLDSGQPSPSEGHPHPFGAPALRLGWS